MTKEYNGNLWTEAQADGRVRIGFSKRFIEDRLGECFHVMQADMREVKKGGPMLVIETNDGLESLKSPLSGTILVFNDKARNFPDRLTEEDNILEVLPVGVKLPPAKKVAKEKAENIMNWGNAQIEVEDLFNRPLAPPPPEGPVQEIERRARERVLQQEALRDLAELVVRGGRRPR